MSDAELKALNYEYESMRMELRKRLIDAHTRRVRKQQLDAEIAAAHATFARNESTIASLLETLDDLDPIAQTAMAKQAELEADLTEAKKVAKEVYNALVDQMQHIRKFEILREEMPGFSAL